MRLTNAARIGVFPIIGLWFGCNAIIGLELGELAPEGTGSGGSTATSTDIGGSTTSGSWGESSSSGMGGTGATTSSTGMGEGGGAGGGPYFDCDLSGPLVVEDLASFEAGTCARLSNGDVRCWGYDSWGQLGRGYYNLAGDPDPVTVPLPGPAHVIDAHLAACAIVGDCEAPELYCWGRNIEGQIGVQPVQMNEVRPPTKVELPGTPVDVVTASFHTCAIVDVFGVRRVYCWGQSDRGQTGTVTPLPNLVLQPFEVQLDPTLTPKSLHAGHEMTCALVDGPNGPDGARCWGVNYAGIFGSMNPDTPTPFAHPNVAPGAKLAIDNSFTACSWEGSSVSCWGYNYYGALNGVSDPDPHPTAVTDNLGDAVVEVSVGEGILVSTQSGTIYVRGDGRSAPFIPDNGDPPDYTSLNITAPLTGFGPLELDNLCGVAPDGSAQCWGFSSKGSMGPNYNSMNMLHYVLP